MWGEERCIGAVTTGHGNQNSKLQNLFNVDLLSSKIPNHLPFIDTLSLVMCCFYSPWNNCSPLPPPPVTKHTLKGSWCNLFSFPVLLNTQAVGKCFLMLPGNETLDPEVRILGALLSSSLMTCSTGCVEKMIDFQARPTRVSSLALSLIWVTLVNLLNFLNFLIYKMRVIYYMYCFKN